SPIKLTFVLKTINGARGLMLPASHAGNQGSIPRGVTCFTYHSDFGKHYFCTAGLLRESKPTILFITIHWYEEDFSFL
ncbi:MAG: hypothetical protein MK238_10825, partial [Nitrospinales bacterium]|nr:hypothetical protein [Nitrospinales bacterium]